MPASFDHDKLGRCGYAALIGPANAGKSTLLNAYLGQKVAIVSSKPQTTRTQISGIFSEGSNQIVFLDTPGLHRQKGRMGKAMLQSAHQALAGADVVLALLDSARLLKKPGSARSDLELLARSLKGVTTPTLLVLTKIDLIKDKKELLPLMELLAAALPQASIHLVSALRRDGLDQLLSAVLELLPLSPPIFPEDQISTAPLRFMAAEIIREKLFERLRQELPYSVAVDIEKWEEIPRRNLCRINAVIFVSRKHHKSIIIGKQGQVLKEVGAAARLDIQDLLEQKVHLELWVKVQESWQEDLGFLRSIGLAT